MSTVLASSRGLPVLVVLVGAALVGCAPTSQAIPPATVTATEVPSPAGNAGGLPPRDDAGPTTVVDGVPMGFSSDRAGAVAAAISFVRLNQALVEMSEPAAEAARRAMATEEAADALAEDVVIHLREIRERWPRGSLRYRVAPLAVRAVEAGPGAMDVDVWYVGVVGGAQLPTYEEWVTESYRLVRQRGDWRVAALSESPGPRPHPGPQQAAPAAELEALLAGFEAVP